jgi:hypothetical protein
LANPQTGWLYPPAWLLRIDFWTFLPLYHFLHFVMAALGCWAWLRRFLGDRCGPLLGAICYTACGSSFSLSLYPDKLPGFAALPLLLLGVQLLFDEGHPPRRARGWLCGVLSIAIGWLAGSFEILLIMGLMVFLQILFLSRGADGGASARTIRRLLWGGGMLLMGTALASCIVIPFFYYFPEMYRSQHLSLRQAMSLSTHPLDWLAWICPNPFWQGEDLHYRITSQLIPSRAKWLRSQYTGATVFLLLTLVSLERHRRREQLYLLACFAGFVFLALGEYNPLKEFIYRLPGFNLIQYPDKWWLGTVPLVAWAAARGLQTLEAQPSAAGRRLSICGTVAVGVALLYWLICSGIELRWGEAFYRQQPILGALERASSAFLRAMPMLLGMILLGLATLRGALRPRSIGALACALIALDLIMAAWASVPYGNLRAAREPGAAVRMIQKDREKWPESWGIPRIWEETYHVENRLPAVPFGEAYREMQRDLALPNLAQAYRLGYIDGMRASRLERQANFSRHLDELPLPQRHALLRAVGVEYWIVYNFAALPQILAETPLRPLPPLAGEPYRAVVLAEPHPLGRLRLVPRRLTLSTEGRAWRALIHRDPRETVVLLDKDPGIAAFDPLARGPLRRRDTPASLATSSSVAAQFSYRYLSPGHWQARWQSSFPAALVLQESWTKGWEVKIDEGSWQPAARVDHVLVGAFAPPGRHRAELRYRVPGLSWGIGLSVLSLAMVLLIAWRIRGRA